MAENAATGNVQHVQSARGYGFEQQQRGYAYANPSNENSAPTARELLPPSINQERPKGGPKKPKPKLARLITNL